MRFKCKSRKYDALDDDYDFFRMLDIFLDTYSRKFYVYFLLFIPGHKKDSKNAKIFAHKSKFTC